MINQKMLIIIVLFIVILFLLVYSFSTRTQYKKTLEITNRPSLVQKKSQKNTTTTKGVISKDANDGTLISENSQRTVSPEEYQKMVLEDI